MDSLQAEQELRKILTSVDGRARKVLASHVRHIGDQLARGEPLHENTRNATRSIQAAAANMEREWFNALRKFDVEKARVAGSRMAAGAKSQAMSRAREQMENSWRASIRRGHEAAFRAGAAARGVPKASQLTTMQISRMDPAFDRMVQRQTQFASQFARQYGSGALNAPGRMGVGPRSKMYVNGLKGGYNAGAVSGGDPGEIIHWKLGSCDHCTDCPALASSGPYTRATLPTYPGQGDTICRSNCCCYLVFKKGVAPKGEPPQDEMGEFLRPGRNTPPGYQKPNAADTAFLRDLEMRRNFARRKVAEFPPGPERTKWLRERSSLQGQMNSYRRDRNIHWTPRFSVGDALTKTDVRLSTIDDMLLRGLDGSTLSQGDARQISQLLKRSNKELTDAMAGLNIPAATPVVPTPAAVIRIQTGADDAMTDYAAYLRAAKVSEGAARLGGLSLLEQDGPVVTTEWIVNLVGLGLRNTYKIHLGLVATLSTASRPYYVEVGPLDEDWQTLVSAAGIWIRGGGDEVERLLKDLANRPGVPAFAVAGYVP